VCPLIAYGTMLDYEKHPANLQMLLNGQPFSQEFEDLLKNSGLLPATLSGTLNITSTIPPSSGLGSSAALCAALAYFLFTQGYLLRENIFDVAKECENFFHGQSSGVDIAGVMAERVLLYRMNQRGLAFTPTWQPYLTVSGGIPQIQRRVWQRCVSIVTCFLSSDGLYFLPR